MAAKRATKKSSAPKVTGRATTIAPAWRPVVEAYGGVDAFALAVGVDRTTVWKWGTGRRSPRGTARTVVETLARRKRVPSPWDEQEDED